MELTLLRRKNTMVNYREILRLRNLGYTQRQIASSVHSSRKTISEVFVLANEKGLFWPLTEEMTNEDIRKMFYPARIQKGERKMPDCAYLHKEMAKSSVTLTLLWSEYAQQCRNEDQIPYQYTQFCDHYRAYARKTKATMRIKRKPGELLEVDWAGSTLPVFDQHTGETTPAYIFVASLACSLYSYEDIKDKPNVEGTVGVIST
jgi:transposase